MFQANSSVDKVAVIHKIVVVFVWMKLTRCCQVSFCFFRTEPGALFSHFQSLCYKLSVPAAGSSYKKRVISIVSSNSYSESNVHFSKCQTISLTCKHGHYLTDKNKLKSYVWTCDRTVKLAQHNNKKYSLCHILWKIMSKHQTTLTISSLIYTWKIFPTFPFWRLS